MQTASGRVLAAVAGGPFRGAAALWSAAAAACSSAAALSTTASHAAALQRLRWPTGVPVPTWGADAATAGTSSSSASASSGREPAGVGRQAWRALATQARSQQQQPGPKPKPRGEPEDAKLMRTRVVLGVLRATEEPLASQALYDRLQEHHADAGIQSRCHLKELLKRLKDNGWVRPVPGGRGQPFVFKVTAAGLQVPLEGGQEARHLRVARALAADIKEQLQATAGGEQ
jgi:hypothetical protein